MGWDHPRACGEEYLDAPYLVRLVGSPPRVRGRAYRWRSIAPGNGITPARAGKSRIASKTHNQVQDHPRACGEEGVSVPPLLCRKGSPPRVRGRVARYGSGTSYPGITPARAGKRRSASIYPFPGGDHPRACGEEFLNSGYSIRLTGSPPRVRGRADLPGSYTETPGITPARAGKSELHRTPCGYGKDHPRACGEEPLKNWAGR